MRLPSRATLRAAARSFIEDALPILAILALAVAALIALP